MSRGTTEKKHIEIIKKHLMFLFVKIEMIMNLFTEKDISLKFNIFNMNNKFSKLFNLELSKRIVQKFSFSLKSPIKNFSILKNLTSKIQIIVTNKFTLSNAFYDFLVFNNNTAHK